MAKKNGYDKDELFKDGMKYVKELKFVFHTDVFHRLGISADTYYRKFPYGSDMYNKLDAALCVNKVEIKAGIRNKWYRSKADQGGLYLYKLLGTKEERSRLSYNKNDNTNDTKVELTDRRIDYSKLSDATLEELNNAIEESEKSKPE